jgi:integrase|tara:strand:- start:227 stop:829 length:603 start_codon:yes stop_codon:yes gene_type:complete
MVQSIDYPELMHLLTKPLEPRTRALIAFQYASAARIGELLPYTHKIKDKETDRLVYSHYTNGLLKSNFFMGVNKITWRLPNFKTKSKKRLIKEPFVLKEEKVLWDIITSWLANCSEQVFELREARARELIRNVISPYSSHVLRKSRGTHLADLFGYNAYEIREALGHSSLETGIHYVSTVNSEKKMRAKLIEMMKMVMNR